MHVYGHKSSQCGASLFGQFPSHQLHNIIQLQLQLLMVISQTLQKAQVQVRHAVTAIGKM